MQAELDGVGGGRDWGSVNGTTWALKQGPIKVYHARVREQSYWPVGTPRRQIPQLNCLSSHGFTRDITLPSAAQTVPSGSQAPKAGSSPLASLISPHLCVHLAEQLGRGGPALPPDKKVSVHRYLYSFTPLQRT